MIAAATQRLIFKESQNRWSARKLLEVQRLRRALGGGSVPGEIVPTHRRGLRATKCRFGSLLAGPSNVGHRSKQTEKIVTHNRHAFRPSIATPRG